MILYYHMLGADVGELNIYVRFYSNGPLQKLYGVSGSISTVVFLHGFDCA